jgi:DNA-directed RNA polymerase beta' subunit
MMSTNNTFSPANGQPIISPSQDVVMGCCYLTASRGHRRAGTAARRQRAEGDLRPPARAQQRHSRPT